jgi:hypothetical protein
MKKSELRKIVREIIMESLPQDFSMPRYSSFEQPVPEPEIANNKFEKNIPNPSKEDSKVQGGMSKTDKIISKNQKTNFHPLNDI